ncbi:DUF7919 family protein [Rugamonas rivuli]|uniref:DUF7919 domain-containing protein n=1 Tax=Rugamonas rivuli TaxID=2743358 RepID=A0A843SE99_9BURK|nr:hypothetical protein [Rugamonas rivuli]MQA18806.1 hypothetical protein [Rugamonas rivuli]
MNYFKDLTNYTHQISPYEMRDVKNVGWLNIGEKFSVGEVPSELILKLKILASGRVALKPLVEPIREMPFCEVCGSVELKGEGGKFLPNAELWIPSGNCIYASPIIIIHFIEFHNYFPPLEFISAIRSLDLNFNFDADKIYGEKLIECGWAGRNK